MRLRHKHLEMYTAKGLGSEIRDTVYVHTERKTQLSVSLHRAKKGFFV